MGRPSTYSPALIDAILSRMASGESLSNICSAEGMPHRATVRNWIKRHRVHAEHYAAAKHEQAVASGRVTGYSSALAEAICEQIMCGKTLQKICAMKGMPSFVALMNWIGRYPEFDANYARAKAFQADVLADEILDIADDPTIDPVRLRVRVEARKWLAAKFKPRRYGDRTALELSGTIDTKSDDELRAELAALIAKAKARATDAGH